MKIEIRKKGKVGILNLSGPFTAGGDAAFRRTILGLLEDGGKMFVVNMKDVSFIDSVGLGETVACTKRICERGGTVKLVLAEPSKPREVFTITGLHKAYEVYSDEEEAIASWIP